jgi:nucleoside-diphosphate-sugar epimerase
MQVLLTGPYGSCGTAIIDHLADDEEYDFTYFNRSDRPDDHLYGGYDTVVADIADYEAVSEAREGQDAGVHLAAVPTGSAPFEEVLEANIVGTYNVLHAAHEAGVESFVFASTNHTVGMYEKTLRPELYEEGAGTVVDHTSPVRPDSYYGVSKVFGEALGRYYVENFDAPERFYSLRICNVTSADRDTPTDYAEHLIEEGADPDSEEFERKIKRKQAMWHSRRDFAHQVECCLQDESVEFDVFYGVSDNANRWFDIEHARSVIGYRPRDRSEDHPMPGR